ncbi:hypothetical protein BU23DRAFT_647972 [Bimuria novae-zelandiae CBS 107.79]|uniref:Uncharacterized protein n=1 Tax=Bimuria novae-zelandiae CBS 107.79 TaxID=1447943 RepID=A0A6A5V291_9PLEO|nr:hypothetical protein BU23DRAFT_647972 [Bimuria novae-zelandiae CBS 107.79]
MSDSGSTIEDPTLYDNIITLPAVEIDGSKGVVGTTDESPIEQHSRAESSDAGTDRSSAEDQPPEIKQPSLRNLQVALAADLRREIARKDAKICEMEQELSNRNRLLEKTSAWLNDTERRFADTASILKRESEKDSERDERAVKKKKTKLSA